MDKTTTPQPLKLTKKQPKSEVPDQAVVDAILGFSKALKVQHSDLVGPISIILN